MPSAKETTTRSPSGWTIGASDSPWRRIHRRQPRSVDQRMIRHRPVTVSRPGTSGHLAYCIEEGGTHSGRGVVKRERRPDHPGQAPPGRSAAVSSPGTVKTTTTPARTPDPIVATFTVNATADKKSAGACATAVAYQCSLRKAFVEASAAPTGSAITVTLPGGT